MTSCGFGNDFHLLQKEASLIKKWRRLAPGTNSSLSIWFYFLITHNYRKKYFYLSIIISVKEYSLLCHSFNRLCNSSKKHLFIFNILLWDTYIFILLHKFNNFNKIITWVLFVRPTLVKRIQHESDKYIVWWFLIAVQEYKECIK